MWSIKSKLILQIKKQKAASKCKKTENQLRNPDRQSCLIWKMIWNVEQNEEHEKRRTISDAPILISSHVCQECLDIFASLDTLCFERLAEGIFVHTALNTIFQL